MSHPPLNFDESQIPAAPDYSNLDNWCEHPGKESNANKLVPDGEATTSAATESTIEDTEIVEATNGRKKANRFYLSKIQAVEKLLIGMRKKKKKGQQRKEHRFVCLFVCLCRPCNGSSPNIDWSPHCS